MLINPNTNAMSMARRLFTITVLLDRDRRRRFI